jgi:putative ABC transport system permease protein
MFEIDKWQEIFQTIAKNKVRTFATAFGIFWGIMMLILLLGAGQGLHNGVKRIIMVDAVNSIWIIPMKTSIPYGGLPANRDHPFMEADLQAVAKEVDGIDLMSPENWLEGDFVVRYKHRTGGFTVHGAHADFFTIKVTQKLRSGRSLNPLDDKEKRKVCIIGNRVVETLFPSGVDPIGEYIEIKGIVFRVVGVFTIESSNIQDQAQRIYLPINTFQHVFNPKKTLSLFAVTTAEGKDGNQLEEEVVSLLKKRQTIHPDDNRAYRVHNQGKWHEEINQLFTGINFFLWLVGLGTMAAGIVGVSNIMIIVVKERTKEIGIRKALGARPSSIIGLILQESIFITAFAGYLGLFIGVVLLEVVNYAMVSLGADSDYFTNPEIDFKTAIYALVILVASGAMAGLFPALKAAKIKPVEALKAD